MMIMVLVLGYVCVVACERGEKGVWWDSIISGGACVCML